MASKLQILSLYKSLLREADKFYNYNFRHYALRRIRDAFKEKKNITDPKEIQNEFLYALDSLATIKRQVSPFERDVTSKFQGKICNTEPADEESVEQCNTNVNIEQPYFLLPFTPEQCNCHSKDTNAGEDLHIPEISYPLYQPPTFFNPCNSSCMEQPTVHDSCQLQELSALKQYNNMTIDYPYMPSAELEQSYQMDSLSEIKKTSVVPRSEINDETCMEETDLTYITCMKEPNNQKTPKLNDMSCMIETSDKKNNSKTNYANCMVPMAVAQNISKVNVSFDNQQKTPCMEHVVEQNSFNQPNDNINNMDMIDSSCMNFAAEQYNTPCVDGALQSNFSCCINRKPLTESDSYSIKPAKLGTKIFFPKNPSSFVEPFMNSTTEQYNTPCADSAVQPNFSCCIDPKPVTESESYSTKPAKLESKIFFPKNSSSFAEPFMNSTTEQYNTPCVDGAVQPNFSCCIDPKPVTESDSYSIKPAKLDSNIIFPQKPSSFAETPKNELLYSKLQTPCNLADKLEVNHCEINNFSDFQPTTALEDENSFTDNLGNPITEQNSFKVNKTFNKDQPIVKQTGSKMNEQLNTTLSVSSCVKSTDIPNRSKVNELSNMGNPVDMCSGMEFPHTGSTSAERNSNHNEAPLIKTRIVKPNKPDMTHQLVMQQYLFEQCNTQLSSSSVEQPLDELNNSRIKVSSSMNTSVADLSTKLSNTPCTEPITVENHSKETSTLIDQNNKKLDSSTTEQTIAEQNNSQSNTPCTEPVTVENHSKETSTLIDQNIKKLDSSTTDQIIAEQNNSQIDDHKVGQNTSETGADLAPLKLKYNRLYSPLNQQPMVEQTNFKVDSYYLEPLMKQKSLEVNSYMEPTVRYNSLELPEASLKEIKLLEHYAKLLNLTEQNSSKIVSPSIEKSTIEQNNCNFNQLTSMEDILNQNSLTINDSLDEKSTAGDSNISKPCDSSYNKPDSFYIAPIVKQSYFQVNETLNVQQPVVEQNSLTKNDSSFMGATTVGQNVAQSNTQINFLSWAPPNVNETIDKNENYALCMHSVTIDARDNSVIYTPCVQTTDTTVGQGEPSCTNINAINPVLSSVTIDLRNNSVKYTPYINDNNTSCTFTATVAQCPNVINNNMDTSYFQTTVSEPSHTNIIDNTPCVPTAIVGTYINVAKNNVDTPHMHTTVDEPCQKKINDNNIPSIPTDTVAKCPNVINKYMNTSYMDTTVGEPCHMNINNNVETPYMHTTVAKPGHTNINDNNTPSKPAATVAKSPNVINNDMNTPHMVTITTVGEPCHTNINNNVEKPYMHTTVAKPGHTNINDNNTPSKPAATVAKCPNVINNDMNTPHMDSTVGEPCHININNNVETPYMHTTVAKPGHTNINDNNTPSNPAVTVAKCSNVINNDMNTPYIDTTIFEPYHTYINNNVETPYMHTTVVKPGHTKINENNTPYMLTVAVAKCPNVINNNMNTPYTHTPYMHTPYMHSTDGEPCHANININTPCIPTAAVAKCTNVINNNLETPYIHTTVDEPCHSKINDNNTPRIPTAGVTKCTNVINTLCMQPADNETLIGTDNYTTFVNTTAVDPNNFNLKTDTVGGCTNENNTFYMHPTVGESKNANLNNTSSAQTTIAECEDVNTFCMQPSTVGRHTNENNTFYMPTVDEYNKVNYAPVMYTNIVNQNSANISDVTRMSTEVEFVNDYNNPTISENCSNQNNTAADLFKDLGKEDPMIAKMPTIQQCCADLTADLDLADLAALEDCNLEKDDDFIDSIIHNEFWYHQPHFQADLAELDY